MYFRERNKQWVFFLEFTSPNFKHIVVFWFYFFWIQLANQISDPGLKKNVEELEKKCQRRTLQMNLTVYCIETVM